MENENVYYNLKLKTGVNKQKAIELLHQSLNETPADEIDFAPELELLEYIKQYPNDNKFAVSNDCAELIPEMFPSYFE